MDLKKRIKEANMTVKEVAALMPNSDGGVGISQPSMSSIIAPGANPTFNKLRDIANILGISLSELVADEEERKEAASSAVCPHCGKPIKVRTVLEWEG